MMEQWTSTKDTREAAACGTLGITGKIESTLVEKTADQSTRIHLQLQSLDGKWRTKGLLRDWRSGKMAQEEPAHPFVTIQRGFENRLCLLDFQNKGVPLRLMEIGSTGIYQYVREGGEGLPGTAGEVALVKTGDLKLVAALGLLGFRLLKLEGERGSFRYWLPQFGPVRRDGQRPHDAAALMQAWRKDPESIPFEEVFAQGMRGLHNRERYLDAINKAVPLVLMMRPRSTRSALVSSHATDKAFDQVKRHLEG